MTSSKKNMANWTNDLNQVKDFLKWAVETRLSKIKIDNLEVEISPLAYVKPDPDIVIQQPTIERKLSVVEREIQRLKALPDEDPERMLLLELEQDQLRQEQKKEEEEVMFHSSGG